MSLRSGSEHAIAGSGRHSQLGTVPNEVRLERIRHMVMDMPNRVQITLEAVPESAREARRFVREQARLDGMRHGEADLLVTELVGNVLRHAPDATEFELSVEEDGQRGLIVSVSNPSNTPLGEVEVGVGFLLLDKVSRSWGRSHDGERQTVWFAVRTPGATSISSDTSDEDLFTHMSEDPASYSDELIRRHSGLAESIAMRYRGKGIDEEDVLQVANMALLKAIQRYDPSRGNLRPYAAATIDGELKKLLRDQAWAVRVPRTLQERVLRVGRGRQELEHRLGRVPDPPELAQHLGLEVDEVRDGLDARLAYSSASVDQPSESTGLTLLDRLESHDLSLLLADERVVVEQAIAGLPERQREILHLRFNEDLTQSEIADRVGISQMHVSRLLASSFEEIRSRIANTSGTPGPHV